MPLRRGRRRRDLRGHAVRRQEADRVLRRSRRRAVADLRDEGRRAARGRRNLELEYVFPAYTGLAPQKVEVGGDVAALRGTEVRVQGEVDDGDARRAAAARSGRGLRR